MNNQTAFYPPPIKINQKRNILALYVIFNITLATSLISTPATATIALMISVCILSGIYVARARAVEGSFVANHTTFMIRTFWRANLYLIYSLIAALIYLIVFTDYSALKPCVNYIAANSLTIVEYWGVEDFINLFEKCTSPFIKDNKLNVVITIFIMVFPILIYILNRFILGWGHASKNMLIAREKL